MITHAGPKQLPDPSLEDCTLSVEHSLDEQMYVEPRPNHYQPLEPNLGKNELPVLVPKAELQVLKTEYIITRGEKMH